MYRALGRRDVAERVITEALATLAAELARWAVDALRERYSARNDEERR